MNGTDKGRSCSAKDERSFHLLLIFAEKCDGRGLDLESICNEKSFHYNGI